MDVVRAHRPSRLVLLTRSRNRGFTDDGRAAAGGGALTGGISRRSSRTISVDLRPAGGERLFLGLAVSKTKSNEMFLMACQRVHAG
jgi:hypothetical protein